MNRLITPLFFFILVVSFSVVYSQNTNKKINIYENETFIFHYPKKWRELKLKYHEEDIIVIN